jgi:uncharacterized membrane protein YecN with MAPEG domain
MNNRTVEWVWLTLITLSFVLLALRSAALEPTTFLLLLLGITLIKGQLVIDYFMELKSTRWLYRLIPTIWLVFVLFLVALAYYLPVR